MKKLSKILYPVLMGMDLQLFADAPVYNGAGSVTTTTGGYVNSYTGAGITAGTANNPITGSTESTNTMSPTMKTYYDTQLLENARSNQVFSQLGRRQALPRNHGKTVEWRKFNTFKKALTPLTEGVIPTGQQFGMSSINVTVQQFGTYTTVTDVLDMHAVDRTILGATEEMGAAMNETMETLIRNVLVGGTNVMYAPIIGTGGATTAVESRAALTAEAKLTPEVVHKAITWLKKNKAPKFDGQWYVAVIHPSVAEDLSESSAWIEAHKYEATTEMFRGELGKMWGCRFVESTNAPVFSNGAESNPVMAYATLFFGKDAFGVVDPEGMGAEMIIKDRDKVGGPLNQFSTVGWKAEQACKILYQERMLRVESGSSYSTLDAAN